MISSRGIGVAQILASGVGFGLLGIFGKKAYELGVSPGELLTLRFVVASLTFGAAFLILSPRSLRLPGRAILECSALGILGYAVFSSCYFEALNGLSASLTVLLLYLYPGLVMIGGRIFFRERLGTKAFFALPLAMIGLALLLSAGVAVTRSDAAVFGVLSAIFYAIYILVSSRVLKRVDPLPAAFYVQLSAALALAAIHLHDPLRTWGDFERAWIPVLGIAWISTVGPITLFLCGLKRLAGWEASLLSTAEPFTAIVAASFLLGEKLAPAQWFGAALVLGALTLLSAPNLNFLKGTYRSIVWRYR